MTRRTLRRSFTTVAGIAAAALAATAAAPQSGAAPGDRELTVAKAPTAQSQTDKVKAAKKGDKLGRHELPAHLEFRDTLPKTPVGKLSKKELIEEERQRLKSAAE